jgi:hypothetical protein
MSGFGLRQTALSTDYVVILFLGGAANLLIGPLYNLRQGQFDVIGNALDLGQPLGANLVDERHQGVFVEPSGRFWRQVAWSSSRAEIAKDIRLAETGRAIIRQLHGEQSFVNHLSETIYDPRPIEIEAGRSVSVLRG